MCLGNKNTLTEVWLFIKVIVSHGTFYSFFFNIKHYMIHISFWCLCITSHFPPSALFPVKSFEEMTHTEIKCSDLCLSCLLADEVKDSKSGNSFRWKIQHAASYQGTLDLNSTVLQSPHFFTPEGHLSPSHFPVHLLWQVTYVYAQ